MNDKVNYVDISSFRLEVGDILMLKDADHLSKSLVAKVTKVLEDAEDYSRYTLLVMRTTDKFMAGTSFDYRLDRTTGPIIGGVIPANKPQFSDDIDVSVEELALFSILTYMKPFAQQGKPVKVNDLVEYLRLNNVISYEMPQEAAKKLVRRAIALRPEKLHFNYGWVKLEHIATTATPLNMATTERIVDKELLIKTVSNFVVGLVESGLLGNIAWKVK